MACTTGFVVHVHHTCTQCFDFGNELFGLHNHQMYIEGLFGMACHGLHHRKSETDVGYKHAVHHIEVEPVALALVEHFNITLQVRKVGTEQRRGNHCHIFKGIRVEVERHYLFRPPAAVRDRPVRPAQRLHHRDCRARSGEVVRLRHSGGGQ